MYFARTRSPTGAISRRRRIRVSVIIISSDSQACILEGLSLDSGPSVSSSSLAVIWNQKRSRGEKLAGIRSGGSEGKQRRQRDVRTRVSAIPGNSVPSSRVLPSSSRFSRGSSLGKQGPWFCGRVSERATGKGGRQRGSDGGGGAGAAKKQRQRRQGKAGKRIKDRGMNCSRSQDRQQERETRDEESRDGGREWESRLAAVVWVTHSCSLPLSLSLPRTVCVRPLFLSSSPLALLVDTCSRVLSFHLPSVNAHSLTHAYTGASEQRQLTVFASHGLQNISSLCLLPLSSCPPVLLRLPASLGGSR